MNNIGSKEMRALIFGGNLNNPGISGLSCWNGNNPASNSNWNIVSRAKFCQFVKKSVEDIVKRLEIRNPLRNVYLLDKPQKIQLSFNF